MLADFEKDTAHHDLLAPPLTRARSALDRARALDHTGDAAHTAALRGTANEWLALSRDLVRTANTEAKAAKVEQQLDDLNTKLARERVLLEETVGRRGRAEQALRQFDDAKKSTVADQGHKEGGPPRKGEPTRGAAKSTAGALKPPLRSQSVASKPKAPLIVPASAPAKNTGGAGSHP